MIDEDGIERPDNPHAHMQPQPIKPVEREIDEDYPFVSKNIFFRIWSRLFCWIALLFFRPTLKKHYKLIIEGKENIKKVKKQGVIVTINHVHNFDTLLVGTRVLNRRKSYVITLKENINMPLLGFMLRSLGAIPIPSTPRALVAFEDAIEDLLKKKKAIIVCPEASLWPYYRGVRPFKRGSFRFAVKSNVPILPVVIILRRAKRKKPSKKHGEYRYYFTIKIGEPLYAASAEQIPNRNERIVDLQTRTYDYYKKITEEYYEREENGYAQKKN